MHLGFFWPGTAVRRRYDSTAPAVCEYDVDLGLDIHVLLPLGPARFIPVGHRLRAYKPWLGGDAEFAPNAWEGYDYAEWQREHPHLNRLSHMGDVALALGGAAVATNWIWSIKTSTDKARDDATKNTPYNPETQSLAPSPIEEPYYELREQTQRVD